MDERTVFLLLVDARARARLVKRSIGDVDDMMMMVFGEFGC